MQLALVVGVMLLLSAFDADAQPAYRCRDAEGRLMFIQGDPPPGATCSEEPGLRPAPPSQGVPVDWEQKARESAKQSDREEYARRARESWAKAVTECTPLAQSIEPWTFRAHIPEPGRVTMVGSAKARYEFTQCMDSRGHATRSSD